MRAASLAGALAALALSGCGPEFQGSPHGYWIVGSGSVTGISLGLDPTTGGPSIVIGNRTGRFAFGPALDGDGQAIEPPVGLSACFETGAGMARGATIGDRIAVGPGAGDVPC